MFRGIGLGKGRNPSFGICKAAWCYVVLCKEVCCSTGIVVVSMMLLPEVTHMQVQAKFMSQASRESCAQSYLKFRNRL